MAHHDPEVSQDLFDSEPDHPSREEIAAWVERYDRLVGLLSRHLEETRAFAAEMPPPVQEYLHRENERILDEELGRFRDRLAYWRDKTAG